MHMGEEENDLVWPLSSESAGVQLHWHRRKYSEVLWTGMAIVGVAG